VTTQASERPRLLGWLVAGGALLMTTGCASWPWDRSGTDTTKLPGPIDTQEQDNASHGYPELPRARPTAGAREQSPGVPLGTFQHGLPFSSDVVRQPASLLPVQFTSGLHDNPKGEAPPSPSQPFAESVSPASQEKPDLSQPPLVEALLAYQQDQPERAQKVLMSYAEPYRHWLLVLLALADKVAKAMPSDPPEGMADALMAELESFMAVMSRQAPLVIRKAVLCKSVGSFGKYVPVQDRLKAGSVVHVYVEVERLAEEALAVTEGDHSVYRVYFEANLALLDARGQVLWQQQGLQAVDESRSQRKDHFILFQITLPEDLTSGYYSLRIQIKDRLTERQAETVLPLCIVPATLKHREEK